METTCTSKSFDPISLEFNNENVWDLICAGKTKGIFQLESNLGKSWAKRVKPRNIEELAALVSIIRPGTLKAIQDGKSMTQRFVDRKNLTEEITYLHPSLEPILKGTQGVLVYQEQSMKIAQQLAGFNAVSYAICAYWSAYAKTYHPLEFYCNYLIYSSGKPDPQQEVKELVNDAKNNEIYVSPPSIKAINTLTDIIDGQIHFGLLSVKSVGMKQIEKFKTVISSVETELEEKHLSDWSWYEFLTLASPRVNSRMLIALISVGFFSHLPESRQKMLDEFDTWNSLTKKEQEWAFVNHSKYKDVLNLLKAMTPTKKEGGATFNVKRSSMLRDLVYHLETPAYSLKDDPEWVIRSEENYLGVSLTYSRIEACDTHLANTTIREFIEGKRGDIKMAVTISEVKRYTTKSGKMKGSEMAFLCVEDKTGTLDTVTIFSEKWKEYKGLLYESNNVIICGGSSKRKRYQVDDGFIVDRIIELG